MGILSKSLFVRAAMAMAGSAALIAGIITAAPPPAGATTLACGSTVTASVKLTANVNCASDTTQNAITIGAANVTVNLNGYKILGPGASANTVGIADYPGDTAGASFPGLTVEKGTISNFAYDIDVEGSSIAPLTGIVVEYVKTTNNAPAQGEAFYGDYLDGASIHNNSVSDANYGIELDNSGTSTVSYNKTLRTGFDAFFDGGGAGNTWSHNSVSAATYDGFDLRQTSNDIVSSNNVTGTSGADGVYDYESQYVTISKNVFNNLYDGVYEDLSNYATVSNNTGSNDKWGVYSYSPANLTVQSNQFNDGQYGIETDYPVSETLQGNVTNHNAETGVFIYSNNETIGAPTYTSNVPTAYAATLNNNTGNDNRYGLYAQFPTSGSGNHATDNTVVNCFNVNCVGTTASVTSAPPPVHITPTNDQGPSTGRGKH